MMSGYEMADLCELSREDLMALRTKCGREAHTARDRGPAARAVGHHAPGSGGKGSGGSTARGAEGRIRSPV